MFCENAVSEGGSEMIQEGGSGEISEIAAINRAVRLVLEALCCWHLVVVTSPCLACINCCHLSLPLGLP